MSRQFTSNGQFIAWSLISKPNMCSHQSKQNNYKKYILANEDFVWFNPGPNVDMDIKIDLSTLSLH